MDETLEASSDFLLLLEPGTLWSKAVAQTEYALACGALQPIPTESVVIEQAGISFLVRILANIARKEAAKRQEKGKGEGENFNPFLPYDRDLFVANLSPTHVCLLNKYNVVDYHLLVITREFVEQETLLTQADFTALWVCLLEIDGLGFYNSGKDAGASQRHKHLQLVPLPLTETGVKIPIEVALGESVWQNNRGHSLKLPFQHAWTRLSWQPTLSPEAAAQMTLQVYYELLSQLALYDSSTETLKGAYNLLMTRDWLFIVPRSQEQFGSIPVNSLGFAGTLFVRDAQQFDRLQTIRPLTLLQNVARSIPTS